MNINQSKYDRDIGEVKEVREREYQAPELSDEESDNAIRCSIEEYRDVQEMNPGRIITIVSSRRGKLRLMSF